MDKHHWLSFAKVGIFDIETSDLKADVGLCLSWCLKQRGKKHIHSCIITKDELLSDDVDRRVVQEFIDSIKQYDVIVGYYSTQFDLTFMRTRSLMLGLEFPAYGSILHHDLYYTARSKLNLHSKRLDSLAKAFGTKDQKSSVDLSVWGRARYGDKKALKYVDEHCRKDILVLEELFELLIPFVKLTKKSI